MPSTYTPIATYTVPTAQNSYTFTSIPSTYTDLVMIVRGSFTAEDYPVFQFNGDTASNYSDLIFRSQGASSPAAAGSSANRAFTSPSSFGGAASQQFMFEINFMEYSDTSSYNTCLARWNNGNREISTTVGLWRSTAVINAIRIYGLTGQTWEVGSMFTLYGIKAA
jgi:hypothetical protein